jgi:MFS family permease
VRSALRARDYRRFWAGSFVANLGLWVQQIALGWLVYDLTHRAAWLGTVSFCANLPTLLLGLVGGAIADRASRRLVMTASLLVLAGGAFTLSALTARGALDLRHVLAVAVVTGLASAVYMPAMHSVIPSLVEADDLMSAISLNSVQFNLARALGPAMAGGLYGAIGPAGCFALNGSGFLVLVLVLSTIALPGRPAGVAPPIGRALREGLRYAAGHEQIGTAILLAGAMSLFGFPYLILLPALASDTLGLDAAGLGYLMASMGGGAVAGGLFASVAGDLVRRPAVAPRGAVAFGLALLLFVPIADPVGIAALLAALGALQTVTIASLTTTVQATVHDGMRGRVMSMLTVIFFGFTTLGGLLAGLIADRIGVPATLAGGGVATVVAATLLVVTRRAAAQRLRP